METHSRIDICSTIPDQQNSQLIFLGTRNKVSSSGPGTHFIVLTSRVDPEDFSVYHCMQAIHVSPTVI